MQIETQQADIKAKIAELRQRFTRLKINCNGFVRISPETIDSYTKEIKQLEAKLN